MTDEYEWDFGEDVRNEYRELQDARWKESVADGRHHVSHREATKMHSREFAEAITQFELIKMLLGSLNFGSSKCKFAKLNREVLQIILDYAFSPKHSSLLYSWERYWKLVRETSLKIDNFAFRVCVRKRPMLAEEIEERAYDCISADKAFNLVTLHDGRMARNGRQLSMNHRQYFVDRVWDENTKNEDVCKDEVDDLVSRARQGHCSTLICFGQTGTGKTYTLTAVLEYVLSTLASEWLEVSFVEIHGKSCHDLLNARKIVHLRSDEQDNVHIRGGVTLHTGDLPDAISCDELRNRLHKALELRSSEVTERNPISSRSHAICSIRLITPIKYGKSKPLRCFLDPKVTEDLPSLASNDNRRILLVDLAGSERNYETVQMTANQHRESAEINRSLMALKDCFHAYDFQYQQYQQQQQQELQQHQQQELQQPMSLNNLPDQKKAASLMGKSFVTKAPYRASLLTRVLKECFHQDGHHHTVIIATVSPTPTDVMHSVNTLRHVLLMSPSLKDHAYDVTVEVPMHGVAPRHVPIEEWTHEQLSNWLVNAEGGRFAMLALPTGMDGSQIINLNIRGLGSLFQGELRAARQEEEGTAWVESLRGNRRLGDALYQALRLEQNAITMYRHQLAAANPSH